MNNCKLAVCMPAYNAAKMIAAAMDSILSQSYSDFIYIITDDCSSDDTAAIIKTYTDKRILFRQNAQNQGVLSTRNDMLEYCLANGFLYMAIMDADDIAYPDRLQKQVRILENDPALAVCGSSMKTERNNSVWVGPENPGQIKVETVFGNVIPTPSATIRLHYMKQFDLKWDQEFYPCADYHLWYRMLFEHNLLAKNTGDVDMLHSYSPDGVSHGQGLIKQEEKDAAVKQLILSHFSIETSFNDAMSFMWVALYRSKSADDAASFLKVAKEILQKESESPVNFKLLRGALSRRAESYLARVEDIPDSIRAEFIRHRIIKSSMAVNTCKLAVCMPAYNAEKMIASTIDSILSQSYSDFVFIITDDCSTDGTADIINSYDDNRIVFLQNEINRGVIATRNHMLEYCLTNGFTYMAIMDADDIAYPNRFQKQVRILENDPALAVCGSSMRIERQNKVWVAPQKPDHVKVETVFGNVIPTSSATIRLRYMKQFDLRWDEDFVPCADYHLWYKMLFEYNLRAKNTGDVDMVYTYSPEGISHGKGLIRQEEKDAAVKQLILSHFLIAANFDEAMAFMKVALHRSDDAKDAEPFLRIATEILQKESESPVNFSLLRIALQRRAGSYLARVKDIPDSIRSEFVQRGVIRSSMAMTLDRVECWARNFKNGYLDRWMPKFSWFLTTSYFSLKNTMIDFWVWTKATVEKKISNSERE